MRLFGCWLLQNIWFKLTKRLLKLTTSNRMEIKNRSTEVAEHYKFNLFMNLIEDHVIYDNKVVNSFKFSIM